MIDVPRMLSLLGIEARRKGRELWAACPAPDHDESEPSWSIMDAPGANRHGQHHCFGCGFEGSEISLITTVYNFATLSTAHTWIAKHGLDLDLALPLDVRLDVKHGKRTRFAMPSTVIGLGNFESWPTIARRYATSRGITPDQVTRYGLGVAVDGKLANRIVFPAIDRYGRHCNYSARTFDDWTPPADNPRYLNPSAADHPDWRTLFGMHLWPPSKERSAIVVCEGAINALACERAGAKTVAAIDGSHILPSHFVSLASFKRVVVVTDNDKAGNKAANALVGLKRWCELTRVEFAAGSDPATMVSDELAKLLWTATYS